MFLTLILFLLQSPLLSIGNNNCLSVVYTYDICRKINTSRVLKGCNDFLQADDVRDLKSLSLHLVSVAMVLSDMSTVEEGFFASMEIGPNQGCSMGFKSYLIALRFCYQKLYDIHTKDKYPLVFKCKIYNLQQIHHIDKAQSDTPTQVENYCICKFIVPNLQHRYLSHY